MSASSIDDLCFCEAKAEDANLLTQLAIESKRYWKYPDSWIEMWLPKLTIDEAYINRNHVVRASRGNEIVGFYALDFGEECAMLDHLWVRPRYIGLKVGSRLFIHAETLAKARGAGLIRVVSDPNAESFYRKMGMRKVSSMSGTVLGELREIPCFEKDI